VGFEGSDRPPAPRPTPTRNAAARRWRSTTRSPASARRRRRPALSAPSTRAAQRPDGRKLF